MKAHLYIRVKLADGSRPYCEPVYSANKKLKPLYAMVAGKPVHRPEAVYHLRYLRDGKRIWESVGNDPQEALNSQHQREIILNAQQAGVTVEDPSITGRNFEAAKKEYLGEVLKSKSKATYTLYEYALRLFSKGCSKHTLEAITRQDTPAFGMPWWSWGTATVQW